MSPFYPAFQEYLDILGFEFNLIKT